MKFIEVAKQAHAVHRIKQEQWKADMYERRWRYFLTVPLFIGICAFFLWLGVVLKASFNSIIGWYIWMGLSSIFTVLGIYTWLSYLWIILKGKKE